MWCQQRQDTQAETQYNIVNYNMQIWGNFGQLGSFPVVLLLQVIAKFINITEHVVHHRAVAKNLKSLFPKHSTTITKTVSTAKGVNFVFFTLKSLFIEPNSSVNLIWQHDALKAVTALQEYVAGGEIKMY